MVRKAIALAVAGMVAMTGPALAADAKASAAKADTIQRAALPQSGDQATGDYDLWLWLTFGIITTVITATAWDNDKNPASP